jgi:histidinol-phosphate aminotransferase
MGQAGAIAALADQDYLVSVQQSVARAREKIYAIAQFNGFGCVPSSTNFVAVDCGRDGTYARKILEGLAAHGIFVRMPGVAPLNRCIRISVGTDENLAALEEALPLAIKAAG